MFFAKEMNMLATRMMVLSKASALTDAICDLIPKVFQDSGSLNMKPNFAKDFDDMEFIWHVPELDKIIKRERENSKKGEGMYESKIHLSISQQAPRFEQIEKSLETSVRIRVLVLTDAFDAHEEPIKIDGSYHVHAIDMMIDIDKSGVHVDDHCSAVSIREDIYKDLIKDDPAINREQLGKFFDGVLKAIDDVNGNVGDGYMRRCYDNYYNNYGITFDKDGYYDLEKEMEDDEEE